MLLFALSSKILPDWAAITALLVSQVKVPASYVAPHSITPSVLNLILGVDIAATAPPSLVVCITPAKVASPELFIDKLSVQVIILSAVPPAATWNLWVPLSWVYKLAGLLDA